MPSLEELPPPPRTVQLRTGTYVIRALVWLAVFVALVVLPFFMSIRIARLHTLMSSGKTVTAAIVDSRTVSGKSTTYYLTASFEMNGQTYKMERNVPSMVYYSYSALNEIPIVTMPGDPMDNEFGIVDEERVEDTETQWLIPIGILGLLACIFCGAVEYGIRNETRLLSIGEAVTGEIESSQLGGKNNSMTYVRYRYQTQFGERNGKASANGQRILEFPEGGPILVVYDPQKDKRSLVVAMAQFVRLV